MAYSIFGIVIVILIVLLLRFASLYLKTSEELDEKSKQLTEAINYQEDLEAQLDEANDLLENSKVTDLKKEIKRLNGLLEERDSNIETLKHSLESTEEHLINANKMIDNLTSEKQDKIDNTADDLIDELDEAFEDKSISELEVEEQEFLEGLTVKELKDLAKNRGLAFKEYGRLKKAELVEKLINTKWED